MFPGLETHVLEICVGQLALDHRQREHFREPDVATTATSFPGYVFDHEECLSAALGPEGTFYV